MEVTGGIEQVFLNGKLRSGLWKWKEEGITKADLLRWGWEKLLVDLESGKVTKDELLERLVRRFKK